MAKMLVIAAAMLMVMKVVAAANFTIGWTRPSSLDFYSSWADPHSFSVGDILVFEYEAPHTVAIVSQEGYDQCNAGNAQVHRDSPTEITLDRAGAFYFICTVQGHCSGGQKLTINVGTSTTTPTPSSPNTEVPPPPPNHGSSLPVPLTSTFSLVFVAFVIALLT